MNLVHFDEKQELYEDNVSITYWHVHALAKTSGDFERIIGHNLNTILYIPIMRINSTKNRIWFTNRWSIQIHS